MGRIMWADHVEEITEMVNAGISMDKIGEKYGVSKQRIYQVLGKYGIKTLVKRKRDVLINKSPKHYWLNKMLTVKGLPKPDRLALLESMDIPDTCPMLGIELNYDGTGKSGWTRADNSPSIDRIDSDKGYEAGNIHIISWRANRIKNDSTPEELEAIAKYMKDLTK